jgi:hypothetical protein
MLKHEYFENLEIAYALKKPKGRGMEMKFTMKPSILNQTRLYVPTHNNTLLETSCLLFRHFF